MVRLAGGHELFFETLMEANRPDGFVAAFMVDGVVMPEWNRPQVKQIVGALVRAARIGEERDEREVFADLGGRYLRACLFDGNVIDELKMSTPEGAFRGTLALQLATKFLRGDDGERWPDVPYAVDGGSSSGSATATTEVARRSMIRRRCTSAATATRR